MQAVVERKDGAVAPSDAATVLQIIERAASNPQVDIDKLERLLQMRERMQANEAKAAYAAALARLQPKLPIIKERGGIKNNNGVVQSRYALWEDVVGVITPILASEGFALSFRTGNDAGNVVVTGVLSHELGHSEQTSLTLPVDTSGSKNAVQSVGSSTSYGKRYTAAALLNLRTGELDDDGAAAVSAEKRREANKPEGYDKWAADMEACADQGTDALRTAFQKSPAAFRTFATADGAWWNGVKAKAAKVKP